MNDAPLDAGIDGASVFPCLRHRNAGTTRVTTWRASDTKRRAKRIQMDCIHGGLSERSEEWTLRRVSVSAKDERSSPSLVLRWYS